VSASSERPLIRQIIKVGTRLLLGSSRAHFQDSFPALALELEATPPKISYRGTTVGSLQSSLILGRGQAAAYLVGSGPSINDCDMRLVEPGSAILLNGAIQLTQTQIPQPLAIAVEDERFVWRHFDMMRGRIGEGAICLFSVQVLRALCERDPQWLSDKRIVLIDNLSKPYKRRRRTMADVAALDFVLSDQAHDAAISLEPDRGVVQGGSVAISALQFLLACKPQLIGLFGIDIRNASEPRFYETKGASAFSGIAGAEKRILRYFDIAKARCEKQDTRLECYSRRSALLDLGIRYSDRFSLTSDRS
jgi:hypothetical protein